MRRAPITFTVEKGQGPLRIGDAAEAVMSLTAGRTGSQLGSPAYVGKASRFRMAQPELGIDLDLVGHNAIQGHFDVHG